MNNRTLNVIRLQFINKATFIWVPLMVLAGALVISLLIFWMIPVDTPKYGGGTQAPLWYFLVAGVQAMTLSFPFSQAMSLTRREFYLGSIAAAAVTGVILATVYVLLGFVELATNGYGINGWFAHLPYLWESGWWTAWLFYFVVTMFAFVIGFWGATIYKRWGTLAVTSVLTGIALVLLGVIFLITRLELWLDVWAWFGAVGALGLTAWGAVLTVLLAAGSYLTLRHSTT